MYPPVACRGCFHIFVKAIRELSQFYKIENLDVEGRTWYDLWKNKDSGENITLNDLLSKCIFFFTQEGYIELYDNSADNTHCGKVI